MSDFPCTGCRSTTYGRNWYFYVNYYDDQELIKRRARLCKDCVANIVPQLLEGADYQDDRKNWVPVERHSSVWQNDARAARTNPAPLVTAQSFQNPLTTTSGTEAKQEENNSAEIASCVQSQPQQSSSVQSSGQDSSQTTKPSRPSSPNQESSSESKKSSRSSRRTRATKSTGSQEAKNL